MQLKQHLAKHSISYAEFARRIGAANASVVARYANGKRIPRGKFMEAILRETGGKVSIDSFYTPEPRP